MKGVSALMGLALVVGALGFAPAAYADDALPDAPITTDTIIEDAPAVPEVEEVIPTPDTEEVPAPEPIAPIVEDVDQTEDFVSLPKDDETSEDDEELTTDEVMALLRVAPVAALAVAGPTIGCNPASTVNVTNDNYTSIFTYRDWQNNADPAGTGNNQNSDYVFEGPALHVQAYDNGSRIRWLTPLDVPFGQICGASLSATGAGPTVQIEVSVDAGATSEGGVYLVSGEWVANPQLQASLDAQRAGNPAIATLEKNVYSKYQGTEAEWLAVFPDMHTVQVGFGVGRGGVYDTFIQSVTVANITWNFAQSCVTQTAVAVTEASLQGFNASPLGTPPADTRTKGHIEFQPGSLTTDTEDTTSQSKSWFGRTVDIPAASYCGSYTLNSTLNSGTINTGINTGFDLNGDGTVDFTGVTEPNANGYKQYWSNTPGVLPASTGGQGGAYAGDIYDIVAKYPFAKVVVEAAVQGSGVDSNTSMTEFSTPAYAYTFSRTPKPADIVTPVTVTNYDCATGQATETTTTSTVTHTWSGQSVWNGVTFTMNNSWVAQPATTVVGAPVTRPMTQAETLANCPAPLDATAKIVCSPSAQLIIDGDNPRKGSAVFETQIDGKSVDTKTVAGGQGYAYTDNLVGYADGTTIQVDVIADGKVVYSQKLTINCPQPPAPAGTEGTQLDNLLAYTGGTGVPLAPVSFALAALLIGFFGVKFGRKRLQTRAAASEPTQN